MTLERTEHLIEVCGEEDLAIESVAAFDHDGLSFAIFRAPDGAYFATDGHCTHERLHLARGLVLGHEIECEAHCGRFNYVTGDALQRPAVINLRVWPVRIRDGKVWLDIAAADHGAASD